MQKIASLNKQIKENVCYLSTLGYSIPLTHKYINKFLNINHDEKSNITSCYCFN